MVLQGVLQGFKDNKDRFGALLKRYGYKGPDKEPPAPPPLTPVSQTPSPAEDELGPSNDNAQDYQRKPKQPPPMKPAVKVGGGVGDLLFWTEMQKVRAVLKDAELLLAV